MAFAVEPKNEDFGAGGFAAAAEAAEAEAAEAVAGPVADILLYLAFLA